MSIDDDRTVVAGGPDGAPAANTESPEPTEPEPDDFNQSNAEPPEEQVPIRMLLKELPWIQSIGAGIVAFMAASLAVAGLLQLDLLVGEGEVFDPLIPQLFGFGGPDADIEAPGVFYISGWAAFSAMFVEVSIGLSQAGIDIGANLFGGAEDLIVPRAVYHAIPIVIIIGAGYLLAKRLVPNQRREGAMVVGASLTAGFLPIVALATLPLGYALDLDGVMTYVGIDTITAILIAGIILPMTFGALGGYLYGRQQRR